MHHTRIERLSAENWREKSTIVKALVRAYSLDFWSRNWKELLAIRNERGEVVRQFGTFDHNGDIFPDTRALLQWCGLSDTDPDWPVKLWTLAGEDRLQMDTGERVQQYWSLQASQGELRRFVGGIEWDGYGGEILVLLDENGVVCGFSALTCLPGEVGRFIAHKRYPLNELHIPIDAQTRTPITIRELLALHFPGDQRIGIFLDHAISERFRGNGLGSQLFDHRMNRLAELGAEVYFGRTSLTAPAQYNGNYCRRGLRPIAADVTHRDKHYFVAHRDEIVQRKRDVGV